MRAKLPASAPSFSLLRYLQSQSEQCFFTSAANPAGFAFTQRNGARQNTTQAQPPCSGSTRADFSHLWSLCPRPATHLASPLNLECLTPSFSSPRNTSTENPRQPLRDIRRRSERSIYGTRHSSDRCEPSFLRRLFGRKQNRRRPLKGISQNDETTDVSTYTLGRTMSAKAVNEQKLR